MILIPRFGAYFIQLTHGLNLYFVNQLSMLAYFAAQLFFNAYILIYHFFTWHFKIEVKHCSVYSLEDFQSVAPKIFLFQLSNQFFCRKILFSRVFNCSYNCYFNFYSFTDPKEKMGLLIARLKFIFQVMHQEDNMISYLSVSPCLFCIVNSLAD